MAYIGSVPTPVATESRQEFTATASQTTFSTSGYVIGNFISVYLNGVRLSAGTDFTATNGYDVVLTTGASAGDLLAVEMRTQVTDVAAGFASTSEVQGTHTTGTITTGTNSLTVSDATGINVGDYVTGEGITPGTTVSAVSGTSITLSGTVGATLSSDPVSFYKSNKVLSPGLVAGALCRAWVNFNGTGTVAIRASYNVSSITDNGTGDYTVTFATAMPDANYSISGMASRFNILIADVNGFSGTDPTPSSFRIRTYATNFTISNGDFITLAIFR